MIRPIPPRLFLAVLAGVVLLALKVAFETIQRSSRHKAGLAVCFPRIARPRPDKSAREADTLAVLKDMLNRSERAN